MFIWTEEMSVGVASLDAEHRHLFGHVNELLDRLDGKKPVDQTRIHQLLDSIMNYNLYHIKNEEQLMHDFECVDTRHLEAHLWYIERMKALFEAASAAVLSDADLAGQASREFAVFAGNWHVRHIVEADKKYTTCFNGHGLH